MMFIIILCVFVARAFWVDNYLLRLYFYLGIKMGNTVSFVGGSNDPYARSATTNEPDQNVRRSSQHLSSLTVHLSTGPRTASGISDLVARDLNQGLIQRATGAFVPVHCSIGELRAMLNDLSRQQTVAVRELAELSDPPRSVVKKKETHIEHLCAEIYKVKSQIDRWEENNKSSS
jgi:hypothetical protein